MAQSFIIEGIDRLGKSTLIQGIQDRLGFFNYMHYEKPKLLTKILFDAEGNESKALELYQRASFRSMFELLEASYENFIMDRGHLGETVYSPRYRGYDGDYVFDMERQALTHWRLRTQHKDYPSAFPAKLILLTTTDFSFIQDDGLSFDFSKKEEEQADFIKAYNRSILPKVMIDVADGKGGFRKPADILEEALNG